MKNHGSSSLIRDDNSRLKTFFFRRMSMPNRAAERCAPRFIEDLVKETKGRPRVLIIGGGTIGNGMEALYAHPGLDLLAFDVYASDNCQFLADGHQIPLQTGSVDGVVIQAVLEHVLNPQLVVHEIYRALRPGGLVYADTPFMMQVHEGPYDFARFTESGHRYLFRHFAVRSSGPSGGLGTQLLWSLIYFCRGINYRLGQMARLVFWWLPRLDRWLDPRVTVDGASSFYFYGHSSPEAISPADIIRYYSGAQPQTAESSADPP